MQSEPSSAEVLQNSEWKAENFCEGGGSPPKGCHQQPSLQPTLLNQDQQRGMLQPGPAKRDWLRSLNFFQQFPPILITTHFPVTSLNGPQRNRTPPKFTRTEKSSDLLPSFAMLFQHHCSRARQGRQRSTHDKAGAPQPESPDLTNVYHEKGANS